MKIAKSRPHTAVVHQVIVGGNTDGENQPYPSNSYKSTVAIRYITVFRSLALARRQPAEVVCWRVICRSFCWLVSVRRRFAGVVCGWVARFGEKAVYGVCVGGSLVAVILRSMVARFGE